MLLCLQKFNINLQFKPGKELFIADELSRNYKSSNYKDEEFEND